MLKKHGQLCEHSVPGFSGRLTKAEFDAYAAILAGITSDVAELSSIGLTLGRFEAAIPQLLEKVSSPTSQTLAGPDGGEWQIIAPFPESAQGEMLFCKRHLGQTVEFAVVEHLNPQAPLAQAQGEFDVQMIETDPRRLLQDFIIARRDTAQLFANDIVAAAHENAAERFPGRDLERVMEAISQRCNKIAAPELSRPHGQAREQANGVHV